LIKALSGEAELRASLVLPNNGQLPFLPKGAMVETMAHASSHGVIPEHSSEGCRYVTRLLDAYTASCDKALDFVWTGKKSELVESLMLDPAAGLNAEQARSLADELADINRPWLDSPDAAELRS